MKNNELDGEHNKTKHGVAHRDAHRVLRVMMASGADLGQLYSAFGMQKHIFGEEFTDELIGKVLEEQKLPTDLLKAADDTKYDKMLRDSLNSAIEVVGDDVGVPTIIFEIDGKRTGYFGPVLQKLPSVTESLKLWDGLQALATNPDFYELKRTRPAGGPETASTAICIP